MYQNKILLKSIDESLRVIKYKVKKRLEEQKVVCTNPEQTVTKFGVALCSVLGKYYGLYIKNTYGWVYKCFS